MKKAHLQFEMVMIIAFVLSACGATPAMGTVPVGTQPTTIKLPTATHMPSPTAESIVTARPTHPPATPDTSIPTADLSLLETFNLAVHIDGQGLYLARSDTAGIYPAAGEARAFNWSPDGRKLCYLESEMLTILDMETGTRVTLSRSGHWAWHPSSQFLVVGNMGKLYLFETGAGSEISQKTISNLSYPYMMLSFSPDGTSLAFLDGVSLFRVTMVLNEQGNPSGFGEPVNISPSGEGQIWRVGWSPAGDKLAVVIATDLPYVAYITPNGNIRSKIQIPDYYEQEFAWSPDGRYLAVRADSEGVEGSRIYVSEFETGGLTMVEESRMLGDMSWTSDSRKLVYARINPQLWRMELVLSDPGGIRKEILPVSELIEEGTRMVHPQPRPGMPFLARVVPTATPDPMCTTWTRLNANEFALMVDDTPTRVRSAPQKGDNIIGSLAPGAVLKILEGPVCADGLVFWKVENSTISGGSGWTAEGDGKEYWLEPYKP